nr:type IV toxin-antitoxin system AbiEi family antitoxin domain-containing protein [Corynebacterium diphtheriae]
MLSDLASQQWGLFTSAQAKDSGVDLPSLCRLEKRGVFTRVRHGVYASTTTVLSTELELKAQWLSLQPNLMAAERISDPSLVADAVVSHTTAAEVWEIGDLWPDGIHFTVNRRRRSRQTDVQFHRADLADADWVVHPTSGLPITTVPRTILDLAQSGHEPDHLLHLVADAGRKYLLTEQELLDSFSGHEDSFRLDQGDRSGLKELVDECFIDTKTAQQTRLLVEETMRPLQEQLEAIVKPLMQSLSWKNAMPAPEMTVFSELAETMKKTASLPNISKNMWSEIYPPETLSSVLSTSLPHTQVSPPEKQRESTETNESNSETKKDTRPNRQRFEEGSENTQQEPQ